MDCTVCCASCTGEPEKQVCFAVETENMGLSLVGDDSHTVRHWIMQLNNACCVSLLQESWLDLLVLQRL